MKSPANWYKIALFLGLAALLAGAAAALGYHLATRPGPLEAPARVIVERGESLGAIAEDLAARGIVGRPLVFRIAARVMGAGRALRAGEFEIPARASPVDVVRTLREGDLVERRLTVAEGMTSTQIVALLRAEAALKGEIGGIPAEGSLLPETYHFHYGDDRMRLLNRMAAAQDELLAELWPNRAEELPFTSGYEAVILASIVEKETGVAAERSLIASVFLNRLERGMRLQSDPTVIYGLTGGMPLGRPLTRADLDRPTPYNTYSHAGLPPTPIANPGRAAIAAVLDPAETDYLYFVADGSGGHAFAETLAEHNRNVAAWRRHQRESAERE